MHPHPPSLQVCGAAVSLHLQKAMGHETKPLLYRWTVSDQTGKVMVYVGKARRGLERPMKTYAKVLSDLRLNRDTRTICQDPKPHYFRRNKWGYRWVHHELERYAFAITHLGAPYRIELKIIEANVDHDRLNSRERSAIDTEKAGHRGTPVVVNDQPCMNKNRANLHAVWRCRCSLPH